MNFIYKLLLDKFNKSLNWNNDPIQLDIYMIYKSKKQKSLITHMFESLQTHQILRYKLKNLSNYIRIKLTKSLEVN